MRKLLIVLATITMALTASAHPGSGIVADARGRIFFVDTGGGVFRVDGPGRLTKISGPAFHWMALDQPDKYAKTTLPRTPDAEMVAVGGDPTLVLSSDYPIVVSEGALFFPDPGSGKEGLKIVRVAPDGSRSVRATLPAETENGPLRWLGGLAAGPDGSLYYTEETALRRVAKDGTLKTIAAGIAPRDCSKPPGYEPKDRTHLRGLAVAADGTAYVAASACSVVVKVTPGGGVSTVLKAESPWSPTAVALSGRDVYVLEYLHTPGDDRRVWLPRIRKVSPDGTVTIVAEVKSR